MAVLIALQDIDLDIDPAEVVGLAGNSGAGKTVLTRVLCGLEEPDSGRMYFDGQTIQWPFRAQDLGIGIVHQEPELADNFDVTNNIFLGHELDRRLLGRWVKLPDQRKMDEEARRLLSMLDADLPSLHKNVGNLSSEQRQLVAIAQAMALSCAAAPGR